MSTTVQPLALASSSAFRDGRRATCGHKPTHDRHPCGGHRAETRAAPGGRPLEHLQVAVGVAESSDRAPADVRVDADRLACLVIDEVDLGQAHEHRLAVAHFEFRLDAAADHLLGRDAIDFLVHGRMNSTPPPETMKVLKPFARR